MPVKVLYKWHGGTISHSVRGTMKSRLKKVGVMMEKEVKSLISTAYPPASDPLRPPHRRTGRLINSQKHVLTDRSSVVIGTLNPQDCPYAKSLEVGTLHMAPRPFITPSLIANQKKIQRMLGVPVSVHVGVRLEG